MSIVISDEFKSKYAKADQPFMAYGTAGFRDKSERLNHVMFRMGILAALHSKHIGGKAVGVMITASHNPASDNGVKLITWNGDMIGSTWERLATQIANAEDSELVKVILEIMQSQSIKLNSTHVICVGRDTRKSGELLSQAVLDGHTVVAGSEASDAHDLGIMTTPTLHYIVSQMNRGGARNRSKPASVASYMDHFIATFIKLRQLNAREIVKYQPVVHVDCANGVGAYQLANHIDWLANEGQLTVILNNDDWPTGAKLNFQCGADYVKVGQKFPETVAAKLDGSPSKFVSFDGDADRIVYYYRASDVRPFVLLDGDRIATLATAYLKRLLSEAGLDGSLSIGLVQTAYANGNSTRYIQDQMKVEVACAKTGVKHLALAAHQWDIGVYFEANGHGTVVFSDKVVEVIADRLKVEPDNVAFKRLSLTVDLVNQTVGDSFSDLLLVETILHYFDWHVDDWADRTYSDLPSRQLKISVPDRTAIETTDAERRVAKPEALQADIDSLVASAGKSSRAFVRPSGILSIDLLAVRTLGEGLNVVIEGTEDVVRVYAEAESVAKADKLAADVADVVKSRLSET